MRIKLTSVPVADPIAAFKYYTEVLGFKELMYMPDNQLAIVVSPEDPDGVGLMLEPASHDAPSVEYQKYIYEKGWPRIVMGSKNVAQLYAQLMEKGVKFKQEPVTNEWGTMVTFDDTFGNYIQIHQDD